MPSCSRVRLTFYSSRRLRHGGRVPHNLFVQCLAYFSRAFVFHVLAAIFFVGGVENLSRAVPGPSTSGVLAYRTDLAVYPSIPCFRGALAGSFIVCVCVDAVTSDVSSVWTDAVAYVFAFFGMIFIFTSLDGDAFSPTADFHGATLPTQQHVEGALAAERSNILYPSTVGFGTFFW